MTLHFSPSSETLGLLQFYALRPACFEHFGSSTVTFLGLNIKKDNSSYSSPFYRAGTLTMYT